MNIYVDFDSTLCDSTDKWFDWVRKKYFTYFKLTDVTTYSYVQDQYGVNTMEWWKDKENYTLDIMQPFFGAEYFISSLKGLFGEDSVFIATYSFDEIKEVKTSLICEMFDMNPNKVIHSRKKWEHTCDGILIDDNINNCIVHNALKDNPAILFNISGRHPWTNRDIIEVLNGSIKYCESYHSVFKYLKEVYGRRNS